VIDAIVKISPRSRLRAATTIAIIADALQILVFPLFVAGAASPADDTLDLGVGAVLSLLLGWHWEFLPVVSCQTRPGRRFGSTLDVGRRKRLPQIKANPGHHRRNSRRSPVSPDKHDLWRERRFRIEEGFELQHYVC
jgi:hypothetical protein